MPTNYIEYGSNHFSSLRGPIIRLCAHTVKQSSRSRASTNLHSPTQLYGYEAKPENLYFGGLLRLMSVVREPLGGFCRSVKAFKDLFRRSPSSYQGRSRNSSLFIYRSS